LKRPLGRDVESRSHPRNATREDDDLPDEHRSECRSNPPIPPALSQQPDDEGGRDETPQVAARCMKGVGPEQKRRPALTLCEHRQTGRSLPQVEEKRRRAANGSQARPHEQHSQRLPRDWDRSKRQADRQLSQPGDDRASEDDDDKIACDPRAAGPAAYGVDQCSQLFSQLERRSQRRVSSPTPSGENVPYDRSVTSAVELFAATGDAVAHVYSADGVHFDFTLSLEGSGAQCVAADPLDRGRAYAGTFDEGVFRTRDRGETWDETGASIPDKRVLSIEISPSESVDGSSVVYAGTEPSNLYRSDNDGRSWHAFPSLLDIPSARTWSFPPRPWTSHVRWIACHYTDPQLLFVGIELGGVMRSRDGGTTWDDRKPGSYPDSHVVLTHSTAPERVYEAAGGGVAVSRDAGDTWQPVDDGMEHHYVWGLAVDPADPDLWYVSAAPGPMQAHGRSGNARAALYRKRGDAPWERLGGNDGLPSTLRTMPYALLAPREHPGTLVAGFHDGRIFISRDAGDSWSAADIRLPGITALSD
jgi:hypothetical protein